MRADPLTDEQREIRELVRTITRERIAPRAAEIDSSAEFPWDVVELLREQSPGDIAREAARQVLLRLVTLGDGTDVFRRRLPRRELVALEAKIKPVIDAIGKEMGLAAIFNKFESGLVYASDAIDVTDTVIKRFNDATASAAPAAAKK